MEMIISIGVLLFGIAFTVMASQDDGPTKWLGYILSVLVTFGALLCFQVDFNKMEHEKILKSLLNEGKVDLKVDRNTQEVSYILIDSTMKNTFNELTKNTR